jgi:hypothetical protein
MALTPGQSLHRDTCNVVRSTTRPHRTDCSGASVTTHIVSTVRRWLRCFGTASNSALLAPNAAVDYCLQSMLVARKHFVQFIAVRSRSLYPPNSVHTRIAVAGHTLTDLRTYPVLKTLRKIACTLQ